MSYFISAMLLVVAVIHLLPLVGVLGKERLASLYGVQLDEPSLVLLMRHRAVLLGLVGVLCLSAAAYAPWQSTALVVGYVSVVPFLGLAQTSGGYNARVARVVAADRIALACLVAATIAIAWTRRGS